MTTMPLSRNHVIKWAVLRSFPNQEFTKPTLKSNERTNQDIVQGIRTVMVEGGAPACFWPFASACFCFLENIAQDETGMSAWERRHGAPFPGLAIPFFCRVYFFPAPTKYSVSKAAPRLLAGLFLGYRTAPGERWNGEYLVLDIEDFVDKSLDVDSSYTNFNLKPHVTKTVKLGLDGIFFPLKRKYDW